jgi:FMN phosphatase YigB (HAD superfamily)
VARLALFDLDNTLLDREAAFAIWARSFIATNRLSPDTWSIRSDSERRAWVYGNRWYGAKGFDPSLRHDYQREAHSFEWHDPLLDDALLLPDMETAFLDGNFELGMEIAEGLKHRMIAHANDDLEWPALAGPLQALQESRDLDSVIDDVMARFDE